MNFQDKLAQKTREAEEIIRQYLPKEEGFAKTMAEAMNYSMEVGGKRLRPIFLRETYRLLGGTDASDAPFMAAMEMIHTHSLVHDDLPALDNDEYRRGQLTTHKVYGEAMGVLAGVGLLNEAYDVMLHAAAESKNPERAIRAAQVIAHKTGVCGMLGGQSVDVENDGKPLTQEMLNYIYKNKTSALIEASMMAGAILAGAEETAVARIEEAAESIGLAFQIQDDILDVVSSTEELGKPVHSDEKNHKVTYVTLFGVEEALRQSRVLSDRAVEIIESFPNRNEFLCELVRSLVSRRK